MNQDPSPTINQPNLPAMPVESSGSKAKLKIALALAVILLITLVSLLFLKVRQKPKEESTFPPLPEMVTNEAQVNLEAQGPEGLAGQVNLLEKDNKTTTVIIIPYMPPDKNATASQSVTLSAGIYAGTCQNPGEVKFRLSNIVQRQSQTVLSVNFNDLKKIEPITIDIRQNEAATASSVSCGKIIYRY